MQYDEVINITNVVLGFQTVFHKLVKLIENLKEGVEEFLQGYFFMLNHSNYLFVDYISQRIK